MKKSVFAVLFCVSCALLSHADLKSPPRDVYPGVTVDASYSYYMSGRTDRVKGFLIRVDNARALNNPGLVFLASGIDYRGKALLKFNGTDYSVPALEGDFSGKVKAGKAEAAGKTGFYAWEHTGDVVAKMVIPLHASDLKEGINEAEFFMQPGSDGFQISAAQIQSVTQTEPVVVGQSYHLLARGRPATIRDFDAILNVNEQDRRHLEDIPAWARRGMVNYYRAGLPMDQLDRMFEMFEQAHVNLVATHIPRPTNSDAYRRAKAFVERCHAKGIHVAGFNSLGNVPLREALMNPVAENWVARDEYGNKLWRVPFASFAADISDASYRQSVLDYAAIQIDAGVDELYYDYALGGTGDVRSLFVEIHQMAQKKGKNISVFGNCKGNILVDEVADVVKTEGTEEAGVWDGKWVHNIPQARFYYAAGDGVKRYESKYEGADPGVPAPGAHDVREGMKCGWRKPIAEASAFQSEFAIAEASDKLLDGWIHQSHPLAVQSWKEICTYFGFRDQHRDLYTDVSTVSKIGVLAPPLIPSFEVRLTRESLYKALAEMNIMYEVVLLHRITSEMLSRYRALIITDIPWMDTAQFAAVESYKRAGGKLYTIGSAKRLRDLSDAVAPADLFGRLAEPSVRQELRESLRRLEGEPLVTVEGAPYVAANLARKQGTKRLILHLVNYDQPVRNLKVKVNAEGVGETIDRASLRLYSPDSVPEAVNVTHANREAVEFVVPALDVYNVITFN